MSPWGSQKPQIINCDQYRILLEDLSLLFRPQDFVFKLSTSFYFKTKTNFTELLKQAWGYIARALQRVARIETHFHRILQVAP